MVNKKLRRKALLKEKIKKANKEDNRDLLLVLAIIILLNLFGLGLIFYPGSGSVSQDSIWCVATNSDGEVTTFCSGEYSCGNKDADCFLAIIETSELKVWVYKKSWVQDESVFESTLKPQSDDKEVKK